MLRPSETATIFYNAVEEFKLKSKFPRLKKIPPPPPNFPPKPGSMNPQAENEQVLAFHI